MIDMDDELRFTHELKTEAAIQMDWYRADKAKLFEVYKPHYVSREFEQCPRCRGLGCNYCHGQGRRVKVNFLFSGPFDPERDLQRFSEREHCGDDFWRTDRALTDEYKAITGAECGCFCEARTGSRWGFQNERYEWTIFDEKPKGGFTVGYVLTADQERIAKTDPSAARRLGVVVSLRERLHSGPYGGSRFEVYPTCGGFVVCNVIEGCKDGIVSLCDELGVRVKYVDYGIEKPVLRFFI